MRVAVVMNMIAPHATPVFQALSEHSDVDLFVVYESSMEGNRRWRAETDLPFKHTVLRSIQVDLTRLVSDAFINIPFRPLASLVEFQPDVVIAAGAGVWASPASIAVLLGRRRHQWAFVPWWVSFPRSRPTLPRRVAEPWVRRFVSAGDSWIVYGKRSAAAAEQLGAAPERIIAAPPVPPLPVPVVPTSRPVEERRRGLRFLIAAQLIERKGVDVAARAVLHIHEPVELWIAGDGPQRELLETLAGQSPRIRLLGHIGWEALADAYRQCDALIVPSHYDVWGHVVSEAQANGMPVIATDQVGAAPDLIVNGVTGYVVPANNAEALGSALRLLIGWDDAQWTACAKVAHAQAEAWTMLEAADAFATACQIGIDHRKRRYAPRASAPRTLI